MKFVASVGILVVIVCNILKCEALEVGQIAKDDIDCFNGLQRQICPALYQPVCAKLGSQYIQDSNVCSFCSNYGNTSALVLQVGIHPAQDFNCKDFQLGNLISDDPECRFLFGKRPCSKEYHPYCATIDNFQTYIHGSNKCKFCSKYGKISGRIIGIGRRNGGGSRDRCTPFQIGTKANRDSACKYLATRPDKYCTLELSPVCAQFKGRLVQGANKCDFCSKYGNTSAIIKRCPLE